jgi:hypothetical protein
MCLLMVAQAGATPKDSYLRCACHNNPDGFGYAIHAGDRIVTGRGMNWGSVVDEYYETLERYPDSWSMFHARLATHGSETKSNCHPFRVGGNEKLILAHNGILPLTLPKRETRSDTRYFAEVVLPRWSKKEGHISGILDNPENFKQLEKWASGNKLAIFSTFKKLSKPVYIVNESLGTWDDGIWWSNSSHKDMYRWVYSEKPVDSKEEEVVYNYEWNCYICEAAIDDNALDYGRCNSCNSCLDCYENEQTCLCYTPNSVVKDKFYEHAWEYEQSEFMMSKF